MPIPINPSEAEFAAACKSRGGGGTIPLVFRMPNDRLFALSVFENMQRKSEHAFFLESVETGEKIGRYSFMGARPLYRRLSGRRIYRDRFVGAHRGKIQGGGGSSFTFAEFHVAIFVAADLRAAAFSRRRGGIFGIRLRALF